VDADMKSFWSFVAKPKNREVLSWIGAGIIAVAAGGFAMVTYLWPAHDGKSGVSCAQNASVASQGDISHVTINATGATLQASGPSDCGNSVQKGP
jgi:hypothetical protein